jgi:hypothetical protein
MQLGAMLKAVLDPPAETEVFLVNGQPVVAHWGFSPDRPWVASGVPVREAWASPELPPQLPPEWPESAEPSGVTLAKATPPQPEPELPPEREAPPPLPEVNLSPIAANPDPALRYVVVGSRYFWSVVALALLLALGVAFWSMTRSSAPSLTGEAVPHRPTLRSTAL